MKWEYRFEVNLGDVNAPDDKDIETALNEIGGEGWELISVIPVPTKTRKLNLAYYFKRNIE